MGNRVARKLGLSPTLLLVPAATVALAGLLAIGAVDPAPGSAQFQPSLHPAFDVATVKPFKDDGISPRNAHSTYGPQGVDFNPDQRSL